MLDELCMGSQVDDATTPVFHDDMGCGSMQLALIGDGCPLNRMASSKPQHSGDQSTASATASTEAGVLKPSVLPLLDIDHSPAFMEAETTARMPNPSVPPQPDGDHNQHQQQQQNNKGCPSYQCHGSLIGATTQHPWNQRQQQ